MKKRDIFLPSLTSIVISCMMIFLSCASQNRVKDELDVAEGEQLDQLEQVTDQTVPSSDELAANTETTSTEQVADASTDQVIDQAVQDQQQVNDDLNALGMSTEQTAATQTTETTTQATNELEQTKNLFGEETSQAAATSESLDSAGLGLDDAATVAAASSQLSGTEQVQEQHQEEQAKVEPFPTDTVPAIPSTPIIEEEAPRPARRHHTRRASKGSVPKIPSKAVTRNGTSLNRFYFTRQGDNAASVSELIYGSNENAKSLKRWNKGQWTAGTLVFYASPVDPGDKEMHSFYQERNVTADEYVVQRGDWLSKIAQKNLGSSASWKEIAVVNGMTRPDRLEVGTKLAIYPRDLSGFGGQPVAQNQVQPQPEPAQPEPQVEPVVEQPQPQAQAPVVQEPIPQQPVVEAPPIQQAPVAEAPKPVAVRKQNLDPGKFFEQNALAILILGGALVLLMALLMRRKKAARQTDDMGDENFSPPTKIKRK